MGRPELRSAPSARNHIHGGIPAAADSSVPAFRAYFAALTRWILLSLEYVNVTPPTSIRSRPKETSIDESTGSQIDDASQPSLDEQESRT